jgi:hypothetical protein
MNFVTVVKYTNLCAHLKTNIELFLFYFLYFYEYTNA